MIQSGAPVQPLSVSLPGLHITLISGSTFIIICIQKYGKRCNIDLTGAAFLIDVVSNLAIEGAKYLLMLTRGRQYHIHLAVNQLRSLSIRQGIDIINGILFVLLQEWHSNTSFHGESVDSCIEAIRSHAPFAH